MHRMIWILAILVGSSAAHGTAQQGTLRQELRAWFERSVATELRTWQREYDATLSAADLATVQRLRTRATQIRTTLKGEARRDAMRDLLQELRPVMKASTSTLLELYERHEDRIDGWRTEAHDIVRAWRERHPDQRGAHKRRPHALPFGDGKRGAIRFVLWDGQLPGEHSMGMASPAMIDGPATVEIFDMHGALVRTVSANVADGRLERTPDLTGLARGTYMASVRTADGRRSTQLVVGP